MVLGVRCLGPYSLLLLYQSHARFITAATDRGQKYETIRKYKLKIENLIEGKKFSSDSDTEGYDAVIKYNGNEYYYVSKTKMLITSEKGAKLSDSENAEVKKILT